jgi:DNA-binding NarL/FixJ family response regulator
MKKVVIIENVKTIREGLRSLINESENLNCIKTFETFEQFENNFIEINFDILLINLDIQDSLGIEVIKKIKSEIQDLIIIVLTLHDEDDRIFNALMVGANNYLVKNATPEKIINVIEDILNGKVLMNSFIARKIIDYINRNKRLNIFNKIELKILEKVTEGNNLIAIESSLKISSDEIKNNFKNIYDKLSKSFYHLEKV